MSLLLGRHGQMTGMARRPVPPFSDPTIWAASRNGYDHPFASALDNPDSIWNRPIGDGAVYLPAGLGYADAWNPNGWAHGIITEDQEHIGVDPTAPSYSLTVTNPSTGGNGDSVLVPNDISWNGAWNGCATFLRADDHKKIIQGGPLTRTAPSGAPTWQYTLPPNQTEDHIETGTGMYGAHGGSRLSSYGGSIRAGELAGADPFRHALRMNIYCYKYVSRTSGGFRWPAIVSDSGYNDPANTPPSGNANYYNGVVPELRLGALLALPQSYDMSWMTHAKAIKIATALKNYGTYVVDNTSWDVYAFGIEFRAYQSGEWPHSNNSDSQTFHMELHQVIVNLQIINNNASGQTNSGGGNPVAPSLHAPSVFSY